MNSREKHRQLSIDFPDFTVVKRQNGNLETGYAAW